MQVLMNAGAERRTACGRTMIARISGKRMPRLRAASHWARGSASMAARKTSDMKAPKYTDITRMPPGTGA